MPPRTRSSRPVSPIPDDNVAPVEITTGVSSATRHAGESLDAQPQLRRPREGSRVRPPQDVYDPVYTLDLATTTVDENVFLFVPNLIGYARVVLAAASLCIMPTHPKACTALYFLSSILDAVDGQAARALGQTSKFGAVLDMVTDRCATSCLLCFLAIAYPPFTLLFQFLIALDFASHYMHMYSSLATGSSSHKTVTQDVSRILWYYYNDSRTLFVFCFANETFFVCLYLNRYWSKPLQHSLNIPDAWLDAMLDVSPVLFKWVAWTIKNVTWPQFVGIVTFPICAGKQIINVVQFWKASKILVGIDLAERQAAREAKHLKSKQ